MASPPPSAASEAAEHAAEQRGLWTSIGASAIVGCAGLTFYFLTNAEAILLDGLFNLSYFATGLFTLRVAKLVKRGDDDEFPVGYAFFEPVVNGSKGVLMLGVTVLALVSAVQALFTGGREIVLGLAVVYGVIASFTCWLGALLIGRTAKSAKSPLVEADAASWIVNAAISSAVLLTLLVVLLIRETSLKPIVPYVDPILVILVCGVTIGVPIRMAWNSLMELLNRTPSPELLHRVRELVQESLCELPIERCTVRVLQAGRTRIISAHILLSHEFTGSVDVFDSIREIADGKLREEYPNSVVDLFFTRDPRWSAPTTSGSRDAAAQEADDTPTNSTTSPH